MSPIPVVLWPCDATGASLLAWAQREDRNRSCVHMRACKLPGDRGVEVIQYEPLSELRVYLAYRFGQ